jgi:hypothetical protein
MFANHGVSASTQSDNCAGVGAGSVVVGPVTQLWSFDGDIIPITRIGTAAKADKRCLEDRNPRTAMIPATNRNIATTTIPVSRPVVGNSHTSVANISRQ